MESRLMCKCRREEIWKFLEITRASTYHRDFAEVDNCQDKDVLGVLGGRHSCCQSQTAVRLLPGGIERNVSFSSSDFRLVSLELSRRTS